MHLNLICLFRYPKQGEPQTLVNRAVNEKLLDEPIYSIYLTKVGDDNHKSGGEIMFGKLDELRCSPKIQYVQLTSTNFWQFKTDKIMIGKKVTYNNLVINIQTFPGYQNQRRDCK